MQRRYAGAGCGEHLQADRQRNGAGRVHRMRDRQQVPQRPGGAESPTGSAGDADRQPVVLLLPDYQALRGSRGGFCPGAGIPGCRGR